MAPRQCQNRRRHRHRLAPQHHNTGRGPIRVGEQPGRRTALALAKLQDLPLAEASRRSGMSVGALKVATHRAVKTLRRRLGAEELD